MFDWRIANRELARKVLKVSQRACAEDSITIIQEALTIARQPGSEAGFKHLVKDCLFHAVQHRSLEVLAYLLTHGANVNDILPEHVVVYQDYFEDGESPREVPKLSVPPIELLAVLLDHGWDINTVGRRQSPLLWYVCGSLELVKWCLEHGADVVISGEQTSMYWYDSAAEISHTPRHPLLLENVAALGSVATFEFLRARGAPLTPGKSWPSWHAPCLLMRAVEEAAFLASAPQSDPTLKYTERISMVRHLIYTVGISPDEGRHRNAVSTIVKSAFISRKGISADECRPRNTNSAISMTDYFDEFLDSYDPNQRQSKDLGELVALLLNANADTYCVTSWDASSARPQEVSTPLTYLKWKFPEDFLLAFTNWQMDHPNKQCSEVLPLISNEQGEDSCPSLTLGMSKIEVLSIEILSLIAAYLDLKDLQALRRVNRTISAGVFGIFKSHIRRRKLILTSWALKKFIEQFELDYHLIHYV